ncbi:MAG TPA: sulfotransferase [Devosiaceae bacterium]
MRTNRTTPPSGNAISRGNRKAALARANALHRAGQLDEAEQLYRTLVASRPDDPAVCAGLGELLIERKRYPEAITFLEVPTRSGKPSAEALNNLGYAHFLNGTYEFGLDHLLKAAKKQPGNWRILLNVGQTYLKMDNHREAVGFLERAYRIHPGAPGLRLNLARAIGDLGDFDKARHLYEQCLKDPDERAGALGGLVRLGKQTRSDNLLAQIEGALGETTRPAALRTLHYAAAKCYLDMQDGDAGFDHLKAAKAHSATAFSKDHFANTIAQSKAIADLASEDFTPGEAPAPAFIVGMPRSGSTLTEQVLSSHPALFGAGERRYIANIADRLGFGRTDPRAYAAAITRLPPDALPAIAKGYRSLVAAVGSDGQRTLDKFLHNFLHIGLIKLLFPDAQIIHCKRQALDCCLSIYMSPFGEGHGYANDLADLGWYYRQYEALMEFWSVRFAKSILTVNYEDTVADLEGSARRMTDFLGLEWDEAVLRFRENERGVSTASKWQVRQPLYRTSVDRWKPYEKQLQPLIEALGA